MHIPDADTDTDTHKSNISVLTNQDPNFIQEAKKCIIVIIIHTPNFYFDQPKS